MSESLTPGFLFPAGFSQATGPVKLYLDESGTLGYAGEVFTMAVVLVRDLPRLETSIAKHKVTQTESKASQMRTAQKLALARTLIEENDIHVYLADLDPRAAMASERKLDKDMLYDSMAGQALAYYLTRGEMEQGRAYRLSMDIRGSLRESYEDMVRGSIGNVLMHRADPLVSDLDVRFLDSKFSAGVQAADLFSNLYRTALMQKDSPCQGFLRKYVDAGVVSAGFTFGLPELADQMTQIAADLRALVEFEGTATISLGAALFAPTPAPAAEDAPAPAAGDAAEGAGTGTDAAAEPAGSEDEPAAGEGRSRSARRRRSRRAKREETHPSGDTQATTPKAQAEEERAEAVEDELADATEQNALVLAEEAVELVKLAEEAGTSASEHAGAEEAQAGEDTAGVETAASPKPEEPAEKPARRHRGGKRRGGGARATRVGLSDAARALIEQAESERASLDAGASAGDGRVWHTSAELGVSEEEPEAADDAREGEDGTPAPESAEADGGHEDAEGPQAAPRRDVRPGRSLRARQALDRTHARRKATGRGAGRFARHEEAEDVLAAEPAEEKHDTLLEGSSPADEEAREQTAEPAPAPETEAEATAPAPKKRTRRSRKPKTAPEQPEGTESEQAPAAEAAGETPAAPQAGGEAAPTGTAADQDAPEMPAPAAPKKRTRRSPRKKAQAAEDAPAQPAGEETPSPAAGAESVEPEAPAPKKRTRRTTRKPKASAPAEDAEAPASSSEAPAVTTPEPAAAPQPASPDADEQPQE